MNSDLSICRVCLKANSESFGLDELRNEYTYIDVFNSCTRLDARLDDDLPKIICQHCANDLFTSFDFLKKAFNSDQFLRNSLEEDEHYCLEFEEEKQDFEEIETKDTSLLEIDTASYYEESIGTKPETDNETEPVVENTFEIVQCGTLPDEDDPNEEYDEQYEEVVDTEVPFQNVVSEESTDSTEKSRRAILGGKLVECTICGKTLKRWSLKHHLKRCHKKEKLLLCNACPKTFTIASDLKIHLKTHDKERERTYICSVCRKGFFEKQSLGVHMLRHEGVREYQCEKCPKKFITKKSLEVHVFTHNRQNGRFICKHCSKKFPSRADLIVHERFHTGDYPYKCGICNKSYAVKSHYNYHLAKHKGVTYKCNECDKEFINRGSLTTHKLKHRDRMPHECPICQKGFASPFKLGRHNKSHKRKAEIEARIEVIDFDDLSVTQDSAISIPQL